LIAWILTPGSRSEKRRDDAKANTENAGGLKGHLRGGDPRDQGVEQCTPYMAETLTAIAAQYF